MNDFSGVESQMSMGFIGSGAFIHNDGVQNSFQNGAVSPKIMHASVKPSDLFQSQLQSQFKEYQSQIRQI